jgi:hypothetical protein
MIIDGMTQATTALPHFERRPSWLGKDELNVHVIGSIIESCGIHLEFSYKNIGDNSNVLIDNIHKGIQRMHEHRTSQNQPLPSVLYLQLDNVTHNKSKALFTYLSYLVDSGVFEKIKVNYLLVGHTHEIIDQVFSRYSVALRRTQCLDLHSLMEVAKTCYTPNPTVEHVTDVTDWWGWFQKTKSGRLDTADSSFNHAFRIKKYHVPNDAPETPQFKVLVHSKTLGWRENDTSPKEWRPKGGHQQLLCTPTGYPTAQDLIAMDNKDFDSLEHIVSAFRKNIGAPFGGATEQFWLDQIAFQETVRDGAVRPVGHQWSALLAVEASPHGKHVTHVDMTSVTIFATLFSFDYSCQHDFVLRLSTTDSATCVPRLDSHRCCTSAH